MRRDNGGREEATALEDRLQAVGEVTAISKAVEPEARGARVELHGEFDIFDLQRLRDVLEGALRTGAMVDVDLSRVAFLDARCARELAHRSLRRGDRLTLRNPSWQARASLEACGIGGVVVPARARASDGPQARNHAGEESPGLAKLAV